MPEVRLIDANAAEDKIMREAENHADDLGVIGIALIASFARMLRDENDFPTIEAKPVQHGRWIESQTDLICSVCKWKYSDELPFMSNNGLDSIAGAFAHCPHCGARMDVPDINVGDKGGADND